MSKSLTTATAVCKRFDISRRTLHRWLNRDDIEFPRPITIVGRRYFETDELDAFIERRRQRPESEAMQ